MANTLYDILEVTPEAQPAVIKASYRVLAQKYHPDKNPGDAHAEERFELIRRAYEMLSDPSRRKDYDAFLASQDHPQSKAETRAPEAAEAQAQKEARAWKEARVRKAAEARARKAAEAHINSTPGVARQSSSWSSWEKFRVSVIAVLTLIIAALSFSISQDPEQAEVRAKYGPATQDAKTDYAVLFDQAEVRAREEAKARVQAAVEARVTDYAVLFDQAEVRAREEAKARVQAAVEARGQEEEARVRAREAAEAQARVRYRNQGDGTVTDVQTGLQWMRCALGQAWTGLTCTVPPGEADRYNWQAALNAAQTLNRQGGYAGHRDWRVPTIEELHTLVYCYLGPSQCFGHYPIIDQQNFPNTPASGFWSSSPDADEQILAWAVYFFDGRNAAFHKSNPLFVRLVRGGQ